MNRTIYALTAAVISYAALALIDTTNAVQALIALPGSAGLLMALWEIIKANIEHQHRLEEKNAENAFVLSATSHMAQKAFDKHVEFCEKYVKEAIDGLGILFREGPTEKALDIARKLYLVRREFILWETRQVTMFLDKFEYALRDIGTEKQILEHVPVSEERTRLVEMLYDKFKEIVDLKKLPDKPTPEIAVTSIIDRLRDHLGVTELTSLRRHYIDEAAKRIGKH